MSARLRPTCAALLALAATAIIALLLTPTAHATLNNSFCTLGTEAGKCERPEALALDRETNRVYIADSENQRIDVFKTTGEFLFAFGWGVDTGAAEAQTCTAASTCQAGIAGSGAGQLSGVQFNPETGGTKGGPIFLAVDNDPASPSHHDLYVAEEVNRRVQKFDPTGKFLLMFGGDVVSGGASGTGNLASGSTTVSALKATNKEFAAGQTISGAGIPAGTTVTATTAGPSATLTLSKAAEATATGVALAAAAGAANKPINEKQSVELKGGPTGGTFTLSLAARQGFAAATTATIAAGATAATVRERLEALTTIGAANVEVSGAPGGPWTLEFKGVLADTNVQQVEGDGSGLTPAGGKSVAVATTQDGAGAAEICALAADCQRGVLGGGPGQFSQIKGIGVTGPAGTVYVFDTRDIGQCEGKAGNGREFNRRLQKFKDSGAPSEEKLLTDTPCANVATFTVASGGNFYLVNEIGDMAIRKYDASGTFLKTLLNSQGSRTLAVDSGDNLYAAQTDSRTQAVEDYVVIARYDGASGELLRRFGQGEIQESGKGLAVSATNHIFASERLTGAEGVGQIGGKIVDLSEPPPGPIVPSSNLIYPPPSLKASPGTIKATLSAEVNPEGKAATYHFEYLTQKAYEEAGNSFTGATKTEELPAYSNEVQRLWVKATAGQFRLIFGSGGPGVSETADLAYNATPAQIQSALNALANISAGGGSVSVKAVSEAATYLVTFDGGPLANTDVALLKYANGTTPLSGGQAKIEIYTFAGGGQGLFLLRGVEKQIGCNDPLTEAGKCLVPETAYRFRILATNPDGQGNTPVEGSFETKPAPEFLATFSTAVGPDSARLGAELNPFGLPTTGVFEYVEDAKYQESGFAEASKAPPAGSLDFGKGEAAVKRSVAAFPLKAGTTYHYRLAATNLLHKVNGPEATFRTLTLAQPSSCPENEAFRYGLGALLPDCRGYEMVTPLEKGGADIVSSFGGQPFALDQSSLSGEKLAYGTLGAFGDSESAPFVPQYLAARDPEVGWASHSLAPPKTTSILEPVAAQLLATEFRAFSPDLCQAWLVRFSEPLLDPNGVGGYPNIYRRTDQECGQKSYQAITRGKPQYLSPEGSGSLELQGLSADGTAAIYNWEDNLEGAAPTPAPQPGECVSKGGNECQPRLYEQKDGGPLEFVCVLPNGEPTPTPCQAGNPNNGSGNHREVSVSNAISADGSRVFWTPTDTIVAPAPIYVRIDGSETVAVSKAAEEEAKATGSQFWSASEDGTKAIFTTGGAAVSDRLYEFDVETKTPTLLAEKVSGVVGASEDATKVYFVSTEAIAGAGKNSEGDEAIDKKPNLYLREAGAGGAVRFIATVAAADVTSSAEPGGGHFNPYLVSSRPWRRGHRVSADGMHLAFMSAGSPTGYDNLDAASGKADTELYLYDAGKGKLICASCNPSGARPAGEFDESALRELWTAAKIPVWTNTLYAPRVLSADGERLFFESFDALVGRDTNGLLDVYQWEAPGTGTCTASLYTYSAQNQGCVDLISSGKSARKAEFVDASPSGADVFFSYQQSLVGQDSDALVDIYDARVGGGFAPPAPPPAACEGEACQGPAEAPDDPTPASSSFEGAGNVIESPAKRKPCRKGKVRRKGKCVKKAQKKKAQHKGKRHVRSGGRK